MKKKTLFDLPKLPANINYTELVEHIARAHTALARLDEMLKHVVNPSHLERTFFTREAVLSSKIEGTQVTLEDVLKEEANDSPADSEESERERDIVEVFNYRRAMRQGVSFIEDGKTLSENTVKALHKTLLKSVRGKTRAPGEFRREQVYIAPKGTPMEEARYIPPLPSALPGLYSNFDKYLNTNPPEERDPLVQIAVAHYQFEAIHPFKDGNGRMGRLLIPLFLYERKIIARPLIYISKYFEEHRRDYYDLLANVSYKDEWIPWIRFFLHGLCEQANEATELGRSIIQLRNEYRAHLAEFHSTYAFNLLDAIFQRPYFTPAVIKKDSGIKTTQTVLNLISKFVEAGILTDMAPKKKRNKVYQFHPLIKLLDGQKSPNKKTVE
jgi:Fic family protein